jgi:hypothetical protein
MNSIIQKADILAIPFFGLLIYYFSSIKNKNGIEYILYFFAIIGFIFDIYSAILYFID